MFNLKPTEYDSMEDNQFERLPEGEYMFQIVDWTTERKDGSTLFTKKNDPMVRITLEVVDNEQHEGKKVFHNVIMYKPDSPSIKGMGMTRHFLKCIGEPWEGDINVEPDNWIPRRLHASVIHNGDYTNIDQMFHQEEQTATPQVKSPDDIAWED